MPIPYILNLKQVINSIMGTWGVGIIDNDTASDVYADFMLLLKTDTVEPKLSNRRFEEPNYLI